MPPRRVDGFDDAGGRNAAARDEGRTVAAEQPGEGIVAVRAMPGRDERIGDRRPPDAAAAARGVRDQRLHVQPIAEHSEPRADVPDAPHPVGTLRAQEVSQRRALGIQKIAEHVKVLPAFHRRDFDPGHDADAEILPGLTGLGEPADGVVIGHGDRGQTGGGRPLDELARRQQSVRRGGMEVEIDHAAGRPASGESAAAVRPTVDGGGFFRGSPDRGAGDRAGRDTRESAARGARAPRWRTRGRSASLPSPRSGRRNA